MKSVRGCMVLVAIGCLAAFAAVATPTDAADSPPSPESIIPGCAWGSSWGAVLNRETELADPVLNIAQPDSSASYWSLAYKYEPGETITLNGTFANARSQSFQVYAGLGTPFANSVLTDYEISPDPGSINPFQPASGHRPASERRGRRLSRRYTLTLSSEPRPGKANTLPLGPPDQQPGALDEVTMRVYLQTGGVWAVPVPTVTFTYDGVSQVVPPCTREQETFPFGLGALTGSTTPSTTTTPTTTTTPSTTTGSGSPGKISQRFYAPSSGLGANDETQYLQAEIQPPTNGHVLVVRGEIPTTVHGTAAQPWPSAGIDLRYWSLCDYLGQATVVNQPAGGRVDWGCRHDSQVKLSPDGDYMFVLGTEAQRQAIKRIPGATFLPFSEAHPTESTTLLIRNMQPSRSFAKVIRKWPTAQSSTPGRAAAGDEQAMGPYYPKLSWSTIPALERSARRRS